MTQMHRPSVHKRIPSVLTVDEVQRVLDHMEGQTSLVARLLYGTGMRLMEGLRLWGSTTMIYTHVLKIAAGTVTSPLDRMACPA